MSNITPIGGRVLLKGIEAEETTKSGIIIPGAKEEKPKVFEVVAISAHEVPLANGGFRPHMLKVGQQVVCAQYAGDDITIEEVDYKLINEDSVAAIIE
ncbi:MAG: co-chaperone GroES [Candidatus Gracilibacteria bacterium]|nr:co-chaperone GroES [Candidatus Gracilibacteria bacterium]